MNRYKYRLSICVITMNRAAQLKEALESCLACELPTKTEFVVIDNASTDNTQEVVRTVLEDCGYDYYYEKLTENLGVGGGRNYAYAKACGEYAYMLDDDAVIDSGNPDFFVRAVDVLDSNPAAVTLTTQIYDTAWQKNRVEKNGPSIAEGLYKCKMFLGTSHFLRRAFYTASPYIPNKYGFEEMLPSLRALNAGKIHVFSSELLIIHKPAVNKWKFDEEKNHDLLISEIALLYAIRSMMYPKIAQPILLLARKKRTKLYLRNVANGEARINAYVEKFCSEYPISDKITVRTLAKMFFDFGLSVF